MSCQRILVSRARAERIVMPTISSKLFCTKKDENSNVDANANSKPQSDSNNDDKASAVIHEALAGQRWNQCHPKDILSNVCGSCGRDEDDDAITPPFQKDIFRTWGHLLQKNIVGYGTSGIYEIKNDDKDYLENTTICNACLNKLQKENKISEYRTIICDFCQNKFQNTSMYGDAGFGCSSDITRVQTEENGSKKVKTLIYCGFGSDHDGNCYQWISEDETKNDGKRLICDHCIAKLEDEKLIDFCYKYL